MYYHRCPNAKVLNNNISTKKGGGEKKSLERSTTAIITIHVPYMRVLNEDENNDNTLFRTIKRNWLVLSS